MTDTTLYYDRIITTTDKAILVSCDTELVDHETGGDAIATREFWLPISRISIRKDAKAIDLPVWLARKSGVADLTVG